MKTYTDEQIIRDLPIDDDREWIPAEVAQGLYEALNSLVMSWDGDGVMILQAVSVARAALAAADGEEV